MSKHTCKICKNEIMIDTTKPITVIMTLTDDFRLVASKAIIPPEMFCRKCKEQYQAREV